MKAHQMVLDLRAERNKRRAIDIFDRVDLYIDHVRERNVPLLSEIRGLRLRESTKGGFHRERHNPQTLPKCHALPEMFRSPCVPHREVRFTSNPVFHQPGKPSQVTGM